MRRLVLLLVVSLVGAGALGLSSVSSGIRVNGTSVSAGTFRDELAAIAGSQTIQCYLTGVDAVSYSSGSGSATMAAAGAVAWANLRVEGLAIGQYVAARLHYQPSATELVSAEASLESELTQAVASQQLTCPGSAALALSEMPAEMRAALVSSQASSLYLVSKLNSTIPITSANLVAYFDSHRSDYDTICVSIALVQPGDVSAFQSAEASDLSVASLAKKFSVDASAKQGGAYGCFAPSSSSYSAVRADVGTTPLGHFPTTPLAYQSEGVEYALFVAPTKRTTTPYDQAASAVLADVKASNASSADVVKEGILYAAAVAVDPAFGRWGPGTNGPETFALATPASKDVASASTLSSANSTTYK